MACLDDLPEEVLLNVVQCLATEPDESYADAETDDAVITEGKSRRYNHLSSVALVNTRLNCIATPYLYQKIVFQDLEEVPLALFCRTVILKPELARTVQYFSCIFSCDMARPCQGHKPQKGIQLYYDEEESGEDEDTEYVQYKGWGSLMKEERKILRTSIQSIFNNDFESSLWQNRVMVRQLLSATVALAVPHMMNLRAIYVEEGRSNCWNRIFDVVDAVKSQGCKSDLGQTLAKLDPKVLDGPKIIWAYPPASALSWHECPGDEKLRRLLTDTAGDRGDDDFDDL